MTGPVHYRQAEAYLAEAERTHGADPGAASRRLLLLQLADIHANLAIAAASVGMTTPGDGWQDALT